MSYFKQKDLAFELDVSSKTIQRRIKKLGINPKKITREDIEKIRADIDTNSRKKTFAHKKEDEKKVTNHIKKIKKTTLNKYGHTISSVEDFDSLKKNLEESYNYNIMIINTLKNDLSGHFDIHLTYLVKYVNGTYGIHAASKEIKELEKQNREITKLIKELRDIETAEEEPKFTFGVKK